MPIVTLPTILFNKGITRTDKTVNILIALFLDLVINCAVLM